MSNKIYDLLILGWGKAGKTIAKKAALKGLNVAVIERDPKMYGGTCINVGCLPTKAMVHYANLTHECEKLGIERDQNFNKKAFNKAQKHREQLVAKLNNKNYHMLADIHNIDVYTGQAAFVDSKTVIVTDDQGRQEILHAEKIVINTGAVSRNLHIEGAQQSTRVHLSNAILELPELPERLLIIGAGFIGLEFASYYRAFGTEVEVYQFDNSWLPSEDRDVAQAVADTLQQQGIKIHFNTQVNKVVDVDDGVLVDFEQQGKKNQAKFDRILIAAGRIPNVSGLNLEAVGIELGKYGEIKVDKYLRTGVENIWAAGDVKGGPQFTFISLDDSRIILPQLFDQPLIRSSENRPAFATCAFLNPPLARVGYTEKQAEAEGIKFEVKKLPTMTIPKAHTIAETAGISKILIKDDGKILGAVLFHHEAHEMINLLTLAINMGINYQTLRDNIYTHPTYTESLNDLLA